MRFLFRGIVRETGKPVEGHVEAAHSEAAYEILGDNGIVTESLREDPKPLNMSASTLPIPQIADALESALDSSSSQVAFDDLAERYRGKKVWVIDRDKIRNRVAQVVDQTLAISEANLEAGNTARQRVADAIRGLFNDNQNIASERDAADVPKLRAEASAAARAATNLATMSGESLELQIGRLSDVVRQVEGLVAAMALAFRNMSSAPRRHANAPAQSASNNNEQNEVLLEIFKSNLDLRRSMAEEAAPTAGQAA